MKKSVNLFYRLNFWRSFTLYGSFWSLILLGRGFTIGQFALYVAVVHVIQILSEMPSGFVCEKIGNRTIVQLSTIIWIFAIMLTISVHSLPVMLFIAALNGFTNALQTDTTTDILYAFLKKKRQLSQYSRCIAVYNTSGFMGSAMGALGGSLLASHFSLTTTLWFTIPLQLIYLLHTTQLPNFLKPTSDRLTTKQIWACCQQTLHSTYLKAIITAAALIFSLNWLVWYYYQAYAQDIQLSLGFIGILGFILSLCEALPQLIITKKKQQPHFFYPVIILATSTCLLLSGLLHNQLGLFLLFTAVTLTGFSFPISDKLIQKHITTRYRSPIRAVSTTISLIAYALANLFFGALADHYGIFVAFALIGASFIIVTFYLAIALYPDRKKPQLRTRN